MVAVAAVVAIAVIIAVVPWPVRRDHTSRQGHQKPDRHCKPTELTSHSVVHHTLLWVVHRRGYGEEMQRDRGFIMTNYDARQRGGMVRRGARRGERGLPRCRGLGMLRA